MKYADVILPLSVKGTFTYSIPTELEENIVPGILVLVPFVGNKLYSSLVVRIHEEKPQDYKLKSIANLVDNKVFISKEHMEFIFWVSTYYMANLGDVLHTVLPLSYRLESSVFVSKTNIPEQSYPQLSFLENDIMNFISSRDSVNIKEITNYFHIKNSAQIIKSLLDKNLLSLKEKVEDLPSERKITYIMWDKNFSEKELSILLDSLRKRAPKQYKLLTDWILMERIKMPKSSFLKQTDNNLVALKALCKKHILKLEEQDVIRKSTYLNVNTKVLSESQLMAYKEIVESFKKFGCTLLHGVTSSGKTEIYIQLIKDYITKGKTVLYLLPEIGLTIQIIKRLKVAFGNSIGIYHSGISDRKKTDLWRRQCSDEPYKLIVGVRSSIFLPLPKLGLIIVDEENDSSYKQREHSVHYNARDCAIMMAHMRETKVLLGSATPSFESYIKAFSGKYGYVNLKVRYGNVNMPTILLADLHEYRRKKMMKGSFSPLLIEKINETLASDGQIILLNNRKGYSSFLQCEKCGYIPHCKNCDVSMVYYKSSDIMSCRYCGHMEKREQICSKCGEGHYIEKGFGTEHIEEEIKQLFPHSRVQRVDSDIMRSRNKLEKVINEFEDGNIDIMLGTQMVAKGLDFDNVKLVGVLNADTMLNFPDFRSEERVFNTLMQVSGRSGRSGQGGQVVIQTATPDNRVYELISNNDYESFFALISQERKLFNYPPYSRLIIIEIRHRELLNVKQASNDFVHTLRNNLDCLICGPAIPDVSKIKNMYRLQITIKANSSGSSMSLKYVKDYIKNFITEFLGSHKFPGTSIYCDVDPI